MVLSRQYLEKYSLIHRRAQSILGEGMEVIQAPSGKIYLNRSKAVLFFTGQGMRAPIRGWLIIDRKEGNIKEVHLETNIEGIDRQLAGMRPLLDQFLGRDVDTPVLVDVVTGASISSQSVIDGVNSALAVWREYVESLSAFSQDIL